MYNLYHQTPFTNQPSLLIIKWLVPSILLVKYNFLVIVFVASSLESIQPNFITDGLPLIVGKTNCIKISTPS